MYLFYKNVYIIEGVSLLSTKFAHMGKSIFNEKNVQLTASKTGFYKRSGGIKPIEFFDMLMVSASKWTHQSLDKVNSFLFDQFGLCKTKAGINKRFNTSSVSFMQSIFTQTLSAQIEQPVFTDIFLSEFKLFKIKDSTRFALPECMEDCFKGYSGDSGKSCVSIQYEYDFKSGKILDVELTDGVQNDHVDARLKTDDIKQGDFILRDLGYVATDILEKTIKQGASFVCRLNTNIAVFNSLKERISFTKIYEQMKSKGLIQLDLKVLIGHGKFFPIRMVLSIVPEDVYEKRIRKIETKSGRRGYKTSKETKTRNRFTIFITNIDSSKASIDDVVQLYKLRWQVELCFKHWKSIYRIHEVPKMKKERFLCLLYAKLIIIVLNQQLIYGMRNLLFKTQKRLLSIEKCVKTLKELFDRLYAAFRIKKQKQSNKLIAQTLSLFEFNHWLDAKKNKTGTGQIIRYNYLYIK